MKSGKVWGETELVLQTPFIEFHRIWVHQGGFCSLHKHEHKWNMFYVTSGELAVHTHKKAIKEYGSDNDQRLTGKHETQSIKKFSYGISDRGASIRIPIFTVNNNWNGYLEDRRPAANADPYRIMRHIVETLTDE